MRRAVALVLTPLIAACTLQRVADTSVRTRASAGLAGADTVRVTAIEPGVWHVFAWWRSGPWSIHIVEIDRARCAPRLQARKPAGTLAARATTSALSADALVGINADFFMLPGGTPVGAHVTNGVPLIGPTDRQIFAVAEQSWWIGVARLTGHALHGTDTVRLAQINRPASASSAYRGTTDGVTLFTAWAGDSIVADSTASRVRLRMLDGDERSGRALVANVDSAVTVTRLGRGEAVLLAHGSARAWAGRRGAGDTIRWSARVPLPAASGVVAAQEAVGGFPELLRADADVLGTQT